MKEVKLTERITVKIGNILTFRFLSPVELKKLITAGTFEKYDEGELVIRQGEINQAIYTIIEGTVKVTVREREEKEAYISTIGEGEIFGEAGIFTEVKRTASIICNSETLLLKLSRNALIGFIRDHPKTGNKILMLIIYSLLKKLREVNQELAYERKADADQEDIDSIIRNFMD